MSTKEKEGLLNPGTGSREEGCSKNGKDGNTGSHTFEMCMVH